MSKAWAIFSKEAAEFIKYTSVEEFNYAVNISVRYKYVYVETAKVACSTIKATLQRLELDDPGIFRENFQDIHSRVYSPLLRMQQILGFKKLLCDNSYLKFCFVRNPYERILSAYLDKIIKNPGREKKIILMQLGYDSQFLDRYISFSQFLDAIGEQPLSMMNNHWRPQYYSTYQDSINYDYIGRFENFESDFLEIGERISGEFKKFYLNERRHVTNAASKIKEFYSEDIADKVFFIYKKDFEFFSYSRDLVF